MDFEKFCDFAENQYKYFVIYDEWYNEIIGIYTNLEKLLHDISNFTDNRVYSIGPYYIDKILKRVDFSEITENVETYRRFYKKFYVEI